SRPSIGWLQAGRRESDGAAERRRAAGQLDAGDHPPASTIANYAPPGRSRDYGAQQKAGSRYTQKRVRPIQLRDERKIRRARDYRSGPPEHARRYAVST